MDLLPPDAAQEVTVLFRWLHPDRAHDLMLPAYQSRCAAGMDVQAAVDGELLLNPGEIALVATGFAIALPAGCEMQVRPRSGLAVRHGLTLVNSPGTIDSDYRGEVRIAMINLGSAPVVIRRGDRIAQLVLAPVLRTRWQVVEELDATGRGDGGFGHSGV